MANYLKPQNAGVWFPAEGKTMTFISNFNVTPVYIFWSMAEASDEGVISLDAPQLNAEEYTPEDRNVLLVAKVTEKTTIITDIPDGALFYITDSENGEEPTHTIGDCFISFC